MRRCVILLMVFCLFPLASGHGDGDGHVEPFQERLLADAAGPMDLHGTRLAWAAVRDGIVELKVTDLADGSELIVTRIAAEGRQPIQSLAFDGRWVAWTDGRYGNLDAFAIDTESGQLLRLSEHFQDDRDIDVEDGRFAWVRGGVMVSDGTEAAQAVSGSGASFEPTFAGGWLVWSQIEGQRRVILGQYLADGTIRTLADNEGVVHRDLHGSFDGQIIWTGVVDTLARVYTRSLHADGGIGETKILTDWGAFEAPRTGGGHGTWAEPRAAALHVVRLVDERASTTHLDLNPLLSDDLLVLASPDSAGGVLVTPIDWDAWDTRLPVEPRDARPVLIAAGVAVLVAGAGLQWFRARRHGD